MSKDFESVRSLAKEHPISDETSPEAKFFRGFKVLEINFYLNIQHSGSTSPNLASPVPFLESMIVHLYPMM